jgi:hypothetical protein
MQSCLSWLLTHSSCFLQFFSFIYLSRIIQTFHSLVNFIQFFSLIYFSSHNQQNLIHWFVIVTHPMFTMQPSIIRLSFIFHFMSIFPIWIDLRNSSIALPSSPNNNPHYQGRS